MSNKYMKTRNEENIIFKGETPFFTHPMGKNFKV